MELLLLLQPETVLQKIQLLNMSRALWFSTLKKKKKELERLCEPALQQIHLCPAWASELGMTLARSATVRDSGANWSGNRTVAGLQGVQRWACSHLWDHPLLGRFKCQIVPECTSTGWSRKRSWEKLQFQKKSELLISNRNLFTSKCVRFTSRQLVKAP